jgi:PAS domain S-box-containing protein
MAKKGIPVPYFETKIIKKDGQIIDVETGGQAIFKDGKPIGIQIITRDITERKKAEKEIIKQRNKAQQYLDIAGVMIVAINTKGNVTLINKKGCEILGYNEKEIIGKNWFKNFLPERLKKATFSVSKKLLSGEIEPAEYFENPVLTKNGEERFIAWHNTNIKDEEGNIIGHLSSGEDITERKQTEERISNIIKSSPSGIITLDNNGKITSWSPKCKDIFGWSEEEVIGKFIPTVPEYMKDYFLQTLKTENINLEIKALTKNNSLVDISFSTAPLYDNENNLIGALGVMTDISKRKKAEDELKILKNKFQTIFEEAYDGIALLDFKGKIIDANKKAVNLFGGDKEEIIGKHFSKIGTLHLKDLPKLVKNFTGIIKGKQQLMNLWIKNKEGKDLFLESSGSIIQLENNKSAILVIVRDITDKKKAEEESKKTQRKIEMQNIKLKKLDRIKTEFLNTTSHELRTPMASIKGYIQMLMKQKLGNLNEEQIDALNVVLRNTNRLDNLIEEILDISRLESGTMKFIPEKTDIKKMLKELIQTMQSQADIKNIKIDSEFDKNIPALIIDQARIKQVLMNLVDNAIKFSPLDSRVILKANKDNDNILFEVQDFGRGIPKNKQNKIFERFYQVDSGMDRKFGGVGLGLTISKGIIKSHGGDIWVESTKKKGTTFKFNLPINSIEDIESRFKELNILNLENNK